MIGVDIFNSINKVLILVLSQITKQISILNLRNKLDNTNGERNTFAITSAVSLKLTHRETLDFAKNSSIKRIPIL